MGRAAIIGSTIVLLALIGLALGVYIARRNERIQAREKSLPLKGDLNRSEEKALLTMLAGAANIMRNLGSNNESNYGDPEILRADTRIDVGRWLSVYDNLKEKVNK